MKKINYINILALGLLLLVAFSGCKKEETFPTFESPNWSVNDSEYSVSMTAILELPSNLLPYAGEGDKLAAFSSDGVCRGVGCEIEGLYYLTIKGNPEDETDININYYNKRNKYLYQTGNLFGFEPDEVYGTMDAPKILSLEVVKE